MCDKIPPKSVYVQSKEKIGFEARERCTDVLETLDAVSVFNPREYKIPKPRYIRYKKRCNVCKILR